MPRDLSLPPVPGDVDELAAPASVRTQRAIIRTLTDALERLSTSTDVSSALRGQLSQERERLEQLTSCPNAPAADKSTAAPRITRR